MWKKILGWLAKALVAQVAEELAKKQAGNANSNQSTK